MLWNGHEHPVITDVIVISSAVSLFSLSYFKKINYKQKMQHVTRLINLKSQISLPEDFPIAVKLNEHSFFKALMLTLIENLFGFFCFVFFVSVK